MRVFKFTDSGIKCIKDKTIKLSAAGQLNDPFEISPKIPLEFFTETMIRKFLLRDDQTKLSYANEGAAKGFTNYKNYRRWYSHNLDEKIAKMVSEVPKNVEAVRARFVKYFDRYFRIFCASKGRKSILIWSHYANCHQGFVIEFDTDEAPFNEFPESILEVDYLDEKATFSPDFLRREELAAQLNVVARRKSKAWAYEEEVRIVFPVTSAFYAITPSSVRSITFGSRCPAEKKHEMLELLKEDCWHHVNVWQANLSTTSFSLDFEPFVTR